MWKELSVVCKPSQHALLTMAPIRFSPIDCLLHSTANVECILCIFLRCISFRGSIVLPKVTMKANRLAGSISSATSSQYSYRTSKALQRTPSNAAECLGSYSHTPCFLTGGWLSKDSGRKSEEAQQLSFSFAAQAQDKGGPAPTQSPWHILAGTGQLADEAGMLRQALAGLDRQGGLYLTPVLYRPTVQVCHAHRINASCVVSRRHQEASLQPCWVQASGGGEACWLKQGLLCCACASLCLCLIAKLQRLS